MKKFLSKLALFLLCIVGLVGVTGATTIGIMSSVHEQSFKDELFDRFPALERVFDKEETSKDDGIVIEDEVTGDETQTEEGTQEETSGETTDEGTSTEQGEEPTE